jgi:hypothetical protein
MSNAEANAYALAIYNEINGLKAIGKRVSFFEATHSYHIDNLKNREVDYCKKNPDLCTRYFGVLRSIQNYHGEDCYMNVHLDGQSEDHYKKFYLYGIYNFKVEPAPEESAPAPESEGGRRKRRTRKSRKQRKSRKRGKKSRSRK